MESLHTWLLGPRTAGDPKGFSTSPTKKESTLMFGDDVESLEIIIYCDKEDRDQTIFTCIATLQAK